MRIVSASVLSLGGLLASLLAGCSQAPDVARYTVPQYRADAALREQQLAACTDDPGTLGKTADCVNAREAKRLEETHSLRDLPPLDLSSKTEHERAGDTAPSPPSPR